MIDIELIQFVSFKVNEDKIAENDENMVEEIKDTKLIFRNSSFEDKANFISLNHNWCSKYSAYLCSVSVFSGGFFNANISISALNIINQIMTDACIKAHISSLSKETFKMDEALVYALSMLPYHFMRSEKIAEAYQLLVSKGFVSKRLKVVSSYFTICV